jgi:tetratricopeptide (TPR) repeat protein
MKKWWVPVAVAGVVALWGVAAVQKLHRSEARARDAMIAAGIDPKEAEARTSDRAMLAHIARAGERKQRYEERMRQVARANAENLAITPVRATPTPDPAEGFEAALAKGDFAGAQRLLAGGGNDALTRLRRGRFYDATGKDKRALEELEAAVAAGGPKRLQAAAQAGLAAAKLRQGDHAAAKAAAEAALALDAWQDDARKTAAEVARREERWQDVIDLLDKHSRSSDDPDFELRLFEAHKALGHQGWADDFLGAAGQKAGDEPHARIRLGLDAPYDRGLGKAAQAYQQAVAAGWNDLELHLLGAETAARRKDWAALKAAADAGSATGARDARLWYWQGRAADARNDSELADAMYAQAKARDPMFDPVAVAWLRARR